MDVFVVDTVAVVVSSSSTVVVVVVLAATCNDPYTLAHKQVVVLFANPTTTSLLIRHWHRTIAFASIKADRLKPGILYYIIYKYYLLPFLSFIHFTNNTSFFLDGIMKFEKKLVSRIFLDLLLTSSIESNIRKGIYY